MQLFSTMLLQYIYTINTCATHLNCSLCMNGESTLIYMPHMILLESTVWPWENCIWAMGNDDAYNDANANKYADNATTKLY